MISEIVISSDVSDAARRCATAFLCAFPTSTERRGLDDEESLKLNEEDSWALSNQLARFKIWAGNLGVFAGGQSSADYRLRDDPNIKDVIVKLLKRLVDNLEPLSSMKAALTESNEPNANDSDTVYSSDSSLGLSDETHSQADVGEPAHSLPPRNTRIEIIDESITYLYKINSIIRKPNLDKEDQRIEKWFKKRDSELNDELQALESYARWSMERKFPR
jgi:hypothetical protein